MLSSLGKMPTARRGLKGVKLAKLHSTNPLERSNKEVKRRADVETRRRHRRDEFTSLTLDSAAIKWHH